MADSEENIVQLSFRLPKALRNAFASVVKGQGRDATEILIDFVQRYINAAAKSIPKSGDRRSTEKGSTDVGVLADSPVLQVVSNQTNTGSNATWEHQLVDEILQTEYAEAFRVNIRAVHLLATHRGSLNAAKYSGDAGSKPVPGGEMEAVHSRVGDHLLAHQIATRDLKRPQNRQKRGGKPKTGTD